MTERLGDESSRESAHPNEAEIRQRIDQLFPVWAAKQLERLNQKMAQAVQSEVLSQAEADALVQRRQEEYSGYDDDRRINAMLNNFHCWLPTGYYRDELPADYQTAGQLVQDLDRLLSETGYRELLANLHNEEHQLAGPLTHDQRLMLAELYLALLDRGYDHSQLTR